MFYDQDFHAHLPRDVYDKLRGRTPMRGMSRFIRRLVMDDYPGPKQHIVLPTLPRPEPGEQDLERYRVRVVRVRCHGGQLRVAKKQAGQAGLSVSEYVRFLICRDLTA